MYVYSYVCEKVRETERRGKIKKARGRGGREREEQRNRKGEEGWRRGGGNIRRNQEVAPAGCKEGDCDL